MKKLLALVLALVMTLGLATVGTNAATWSDLKDTAKVAADREEAFQVLNAIQVIEGDNEGNLNPDKQLTRAEAAAIIARLNLGKTTAESLTGVGSKFTDVPANFWDGKGAGYIEYCASTGIIAGRGDGTFDPNGDLTVAAFAKMLLVSLGYNAETEKFLGPDWQINVMSLANRAGLFAGASNPVATDKVTRADAAQFAFNTLKTPLVTYGWSGSNMVPAGFAVGQTSAIYDTTNARDTQTISRALANDGTARGTYLVEFAERHFPALVRDSHDTDEWGNPCTTWTLNRTKIDSYKNGGMLVMSETKTVKSNEVYKAIGAELLVRMANNVAGENFLFNVYVDGVEATAAQTAVIRNAILKNDTTKLIAAKVGLGLTGPGTLFEVFVDDQSYWDDGYSNKVTAITLVTTHTWLAEVTADMNNNGLRLNTYMIDTDSNGGTAMKASDKVVPEDMTAFKEGEKVLVQMTHPNDNQRVVRHVLPSELSTDTYVSGYESDGTMVSIRVDEVDKDLADEIHTNSAILNVYSLQTLRNYTYDVWHDQYGNVIGIEYNKTGTSYVFLTGFEMNSSYLTAQTVKANVIWPDGKMESIQVATTDNGSARKYLQAVAAADTLGTPAGRGSATLNTWFTYSKSDAGAVVLDNAIGYFVNGKSSTDSVKVNQASIALNKADVEISASNPTLQYSATGYAFGNDKTVYITADAKSTADTGINGGTIAKVNGVVTGIKNARIDTTAIGGAGFEGFAVNAQATGKTATDGLQNLAQNNANVYFVYSTKTGYVLYAVVVSESKGGDVVYVVEQTRRDYVAGVGYVDTYDAIVNGEETTIKVDCTATGTNDTKLTDGELYIMRKSDEYYVHYEKTAENALNTKNNAKFGYVKVSGLDNATKFVTLKENTLYIQKNQDNNNYVLTNGETVYFVGNVNDGFTKFTSAGAALAAGNVKDKTYIETVYADCDGGTGVAKTAVFITKAIGAGNATVAAGNAATALGTANKGTYKASAASVTDIRVASKTGAMTARIQYTAPLYVAEDATVDFDVEVYDSNGKYIETIPVTGAGATMTKGMTEKLPVAGTAGLYEDANLTFKVVNEEFDTVKVRYLDKDGTELKVATSATDATADLIYGSATTLVKDGTGVAFATVQADLSTGKYAAQTPAFTVTGIVGTDGDKKVTANTGVGISGTDTLGDLIKTGGTATKVEAAGDDYVTVKFGAALTAKSLFTVDVTAVTTKALPTFAGGADFTTKYAADAAKTLAVTFVPTDADSANAGVAKDTKVQVSVKLSAAPAAALAYRVKIAKLGVDVILDSATADISTIYTMGGEDLVVEAKDVVITPIDFTEVADVTWTEDTLTITFTNAVDDATVIDANFTLTAASGAALANGTKSNMALSADGKTVTITLLEGKALAANDTILISKSNAITGDGIAADTVLAVTYTLKAGGTATK